MNLDLESAFHYTYLLSAIAILLQNIEYAQLQSKINILRLRFPNHCFLLFRIIQLLCVLLILFPLVVSPWVSTLLFVSTLFIAIHFRGRFCGGADSMSLLILFSVCIAKWFPHLQYLSLVFIGVQSFLSYFVAGVAKLRNSSWRSGNVLHNFSASNPPYFAPIIVSKLLAFKKPIAWLLIGFEISVPFVILNPKYIILFIIIAAIFHFVNFLVLGLNRFFWIWISTYPALIYMSSLL